jgi:hypothetical protein
MADDAQIAGLKERVSELDRKLEKLWTQLDGQLSDARLKKLITDAIYESNTIQKIIAQTDKA